MGRTHYFVTSSDGTILYPPNHYVTAKSSKESLFKITYGGIKALQKYTDVKQAYYDPMGLDPTPEKAVTTISVAGSNTAAGIVAVKRGGIQDRGQNPSGSMGKK